MLLFKFEGLIVIWSLSNSKFILSSYTLYLCTYFYLEAWICRFRNWNLYWPLLLLSVSIVKINFKLMN